jgi:hypothetical protein
MQIFKGFRTKLFTMVVLCYDKVKLGYERSELPGLTLLGVHSFFQGFLEADHNEGVWFLESMVKMVEWDFSLIKNRVPRVQFPCLQIDMAVVTRDSTIEDFSCFCVPSKTRDSKMVHEPLTRSERL